MTTHRIRTRTDAVDPGLVPPVLMVWLSIFRDCFTAPVWDHVLVLVAGAVLAPGKRTVSQVLRVMGLAAKPGFARYHEVLSRARWSARAVARRLLAQVLGTFLRTGEVVIGIDDTIERRWGCKIAARGIYRDPVRSSHSHFVKTSSALAVADGHGTDTLGATALGLAISDDPRALRALEQRARPAA
jgi:DDE superfamily endonuclease